MTNSNYYVYVAIRSNNLDALDDIYSTIYDVLYKAGKIDFPNWYEGIGYAEKDIVTAEDKAEFEKDYNGNTSAGYAHAVIFEDTVTAEVKDEILEMLNVREANLESWRRNSYQTYDGLHGDLALAITVQPLEDDEEATA